jgi:hypothetical protein
MVISLLLIRICGDAPHELARLHSRALLAGNVHVATYWVLTWEGYGGSLFRVAVWINSCIGAPRQNPDFETLKPTRRKCIDSSAVELASLRKFLPPHLTEKEKPSWD